MAHKKKITADKCALFEQKHWKCNKHDRDHINVTVMFIFILIKAFCKKLLQSNIVG